MTDSIESGLHDWLCLQCGRIPGARAGLVLLTAAGEGGEPLPSTIWPARAQGGSGLAAAARACLAAGHVVEQPAAPDATPEPRLRTIACPFETASGVKGAVAFALDPGSSHPVSRIADLMRVAPDSLDLLLRHRAESLRLSSLMDLTAAALEQESQGPVGAALATELAARFGFERVSIGFRKRGEMRVEALSHSARFDPRSSLACHLGEAMDEAADQDATLVHPPPRDAPARVLLSHERLAREHGAGAICTVPFARGGAIVGAITFERPAGGGIDAEEARFCEDVGASLGRVLWLARRAQASPFARMGEWVDDVRARLLGPGHLELKGSVLAVVLGLLLLGFARGEHRIVAPATLEGRVQRVVVAGIDGYIAEFHARPGDVVSEGQLLGRLDDRDLVLEGRRAVARREQIQKEYREALAVGDRPQVNILRARLAQVDAELDLLREQLARTQLVAPFDGVVVKGDLSQVLGSPVERGEVLFEVASLEGYRIILHVAERDVASVAANEAGILTLSALPDQELPLTVERVTPVTVTDTGRNTFRVEASLDEPSSALRPGMEGLAKIDAGRRSLYWIWTHRGVDWLRLRVWSWWP